MVGVLVPLLEITKGLLVTLIKIPRDRVTMPLMEMYEIGGFIHPSKTLDMGVLVPTTSKVIHYRPLYKVFICLDRYVCVKS